MKSRSMNEDISREEDSSPFNPAASPPRVGVFKFLLISVAAALTAAIAGGSIDAAVTRFLQEDRLFSERLLLESVAAHAGLGILVASFLSLFYLLVPKRGKARLTAACPFRVTFSVLIATYVLVFVGFYYFVDLIANPTEIDRLLSYPSIAFFVLLLIATLVAGRTSYRWLTGGPRARPLLRIGLTTGLLTAAAAGLFFSPELERWTQPAEAAASSTPTNDNGTAPGKSSADDATNNPNAIRNVVLIVMDTTRRDRLSVYGHDLNTSPTLEALAERGAVFEQASSVASYTLTSHASLLTGRLPSQHQATMRTGQLVPEQKTLGHLFREAGWNTAAFVANRVLRSESGVADGFDHYDDLVDPEVCQTALWDVVHNAQALGAKFVNPLNFDGQPHLIENHQRSAADQNEKIFSWIETNRDQPFFLFANYYDPHWPYVPEEPFRSEFVIDYDGPITGYLFRDDDYDPSYELTERDHEYLLSLYDAELAYLDHHVGRLLDQLETFGILEETLVVITSDHGEYFGEHGLYSHKELYEEAIGVPLLLRHPDTVPSGTRVEVPVLTTDVVPTILDLAGLPIPSGLAGRSLVPLLQPEAGEFEPRTLLAEDYDHAQVVRKMARFGDMKLIKSFDDQTNEELFNLDQDPAEASNLLSPTKSEEKASESDPMAELTKRLLDAIRSLGPEREVAADGKSLNSPSPIDRKGKEALKALGYIEE